jgi:hypothetical protein
MRDAITAVAIDIGNNDLAVLERVGIVSLGGRSKRAQRNGNAPAVAANPLIENLFESAIQGTIRSRRYRHAIAQFTNFWRAP